VVDIESYQGGRRRLDGIPPLLVDTAVAEAKVPADTAEASHAPRQASGMPLEQSLRQENGGRVEEPKALRQPVEQPRPDRRRMDGPSVAPLEVEMAPTPVGSDAAADTPGTGFPPGSTSAAGPALTAPVARRRMGAPGAAVPSGPPAEPGRTGTVEQPEAPASPRENQAEEPDPPAPAADHRPASTTEQGSPAPSTKHPAPEGQAPSVARPGTVKGAVIVAGVVLGFLAMVLLARWLRTLSGVEAFIADYSGHASQPAAAPVGIPSWLGWQHFLNMFFMVLIVRTGLQLRCERRPP
jgi:hypothetical protein